MTENWFGIMQGILILGLGWVSRLVGLVLKEVRSINGRIVKLETWREDTDKSLDRRFHDVDTRVSRVEDRRRNGR